MTRALLLALFVAAGYALGTALLARCERLLLDGPLRKLAVRLPLGLAALAYLTLAVGLFGGLSTPVAWLLLLGALALGVAPLRRERAAAAALRRRTAETTVAFEAVEVWPQLWPGGAWPRWASLAVGLLLLLLTAAALLVAWLPPVAWDDLTYHLAAPKVYARTGWVTVLPYDHHTAFPLTLEMLYTLALLVGDASLAQGVQTVYGLLALLLVGLLGRDFLGPRCGWLAVLLCATTPLVLFQAGSAYTEAGFAVYQLLAWWGLLRYLNLRSEAVRARPDGSFQPRDRLPQWLPLIGLAGGLCYGTKYTGVLVVAVLLALIVGLGWRDGLPQRAIRADALRVALLAALVAGPWIARTWLATGNPVFPFAHGVFASPHWSADRAAQYQAAHHDFGRAFRRREDGSVEVLEPTERSHHSLTRLLTAAWHVTFDPDWFYDKGLTFDGQSRLGPLWLAAGLPALLVLGGLRRRRRREPWVPYTETRDETVRQVYRPEFGRAVEVPTARAIRETTTIDTARVASLLVAHLLVMGLLWFVSMQYTRYLVPHLALWALLVAWGADALLRLPLAGSVMALALALQVAGGLGYTQRATFPALQVALGGRSVEEYFQRGAPGTRAMQWINAHTAPTAKVILLGEPRGYALDRDYLWGERGHNTLIADHARRSVDAYLAAWRALGVTHALVFEPAFPTNRTSGTDDAALVAQALAAGRLVPVFPDESRLTTVYELR
ncbi:MAG: hypothetical protein IT204_20965 [Fimbriimonadaceae bacterium]|nr:hypothetical protein [Fimbriimonadaceae bacterium]